MKLIIDIDDKIYEFIKNLNYVILARGNGKTISMHIMRAIKQGLPYKERPQGEWKYVQYDANPNIGNWHCSECRHIVSGRKVIFDLRGGLDGKEEQFAECYYTECPCYVPEKQFGGGIKTTEYCLRVSKENS